MSRRRNTSPKLLRRRAVGPNTSGRATSTRTVAERIYVPQVDTVEPEDRVLARARVRTRWLGGMFMVAVAAVGLRAASLCVMPDERVIALGSQQRWEQMTLKAKRGQIFDRDGQRLVSSVDTPNVIVDPSWVEEGDERALATKLSALLDRPVDEMIAKMKRKGSRYQRLATRVHPKVAGEVDQLGHRAIFMQSDQRRYYAEGSMMAHVLGYVDGKGVGRAGLERSMDSDLRGNSVLLQRRRDRRGLDVDRMRDVDRASSAGKDVHTTIDRRIQHFTERALMGVMERHEPEAVMAVVIDVKTGDILALANAPTFNPNAIGDQAAMRNRVVLDAVEPGSVFKPFAAAAAMDEGLVGLSTPVDCENGRWAIGRSRIGDDHPKGVITVGEVIKYSSNIGAAKMAFMLGPERYLGYMNRFGFGQRTGILLPGERSGYLRPAKTIKPIELATTSYGQGATATTLQLAMATATIANKGARMRPRLVTRVLDEDGVPTFVQEPEMVEQVVSPATALAVTQAMVMVTERGGTATRAQVEGYRVAGKTGTAWKVEDGRYTDARVGSFIGFVPADDPVLAIAVVVDDPTKGSRYGGIVAAPAFAEIARDALHHLGVPKDQPDDLDEPLASVADVALAPAKELPSVAFSADRWVLPDLQGATVREVLTALQGTGLQLQVAGSGRLASMSPSPGSSVASGESVQLGFQ